jgi:hypothetical protein
VLCSPEETVANVNIIVRLYLHGVLTDGVSCLLLYGCVHIVFKLTDHANGVCYLSLQVTRTFGTVILTSCLRMMEAVQ